MLYGVDAPDEEAEFIEPQQTKGTNLKEPKLILLANGETVRKHKKKGNMINKRSEYT